MSTVLAELRQAESTRKAKSEADYQTLIRDLANGVEIKPENIAQTCDRAGKTLDELSDVVERIKARAALRLQISQASAAESETSGLNAQIKAADDELIAARERHRQAVWPIQARLAEIASMGMTTAEAHRQLLETMTPQEKQALDNARRLANSTRESAAAAATNLARWTTGLDCATGERERAEYEREVANAKEKLATASAQAIAAAAAFHRASQGIIEG